MHVWARVRLSERPAEPPLLWSLCAGGTAGPWGLAHSLPSPDAQCSRRHSRSRRSAAPHKRLPACHPGKGPLRSLCLWSGSASALSKQTRLFFPSLTSSPLIFSHKKKQTQKQRKKLAEFKLGTLIFECRPFRSGKHWGLLAVMSAHSWRGELRLCVLSARVFHGSRRFHSPGGPERWERAPGPRQRTQVRHTQSWHSLYSSFPFRLWSLHAHID